MPPELDAHLQRWEPWVRASVIDFEMVSRLGFSTNSAGGAFVWHLQFAPGTPPTASYQRLVDITRPDVSAFKEQLALVFNYADLRGDRASEILPQMSGATAFFNSIEYIHPDRTPWTLQLVAAALRLAIFVEMRFKHALACRRPNEYSPQIQPMILTPSHGSLPSGHATESFICARVLWKLLRAAAAVQSQNISINLQYADPGWGDQLMRTAARVAINRTVAGVHFPVDSAAGAVLGLTLGEYFVVRCTGAGTYTPWSFDGTKFPLPSAKKAPPEDGDFYHYALYDAATDKQKTAPEASTAPYASPGTSGLSADQSPILQWVWNKALAEWT